MSLDQVDTEALDAIVSFGCKVTQGTKPVKQMTWPQMTMVFDSDSGRFKSGKAFQDAKTMERAQELEEDNPEIKAVFSKYDVFAEAREIIDQASSKRSSKSRRESKRSSKRLDSKRITVEIPSVLATSDDGNEATLDFEKLNEISKGVATFLSNPSVPSVTVHGSLVLTGDEIFELPQELHVTDHLVIFRAGSLKELPVDLRVGGNLYIQSCRSLTSIPTTMKVGGSIEACLCYALHSIGAGMRVAGNLRISDCSELKKLPNDLEVQGDFVLDGCRQLENLPNGLFVGNSLSMIGCQSVSKLPDDMMIGGDINLTGCRKLTVLPKGLKVHGDLDLSCCINISSIQEDLKVEKSLYVSKLNFLKKLPSDFSIGSNLYIHSCDQLEDLGQGLTVGDSLMLSTCKALKKLPEGLVVGKHLNVVKCEHFEDIGQIPALQGSLCVRDCPRISSLPSTLSVGVHLNLEGCSNLVTLPDRLTVDGFLNLARCNRIVTLPAELNVAGAVVLNDCSNITTLPDGFVANRALYLKNCRNLRSLPANLKVGGYLSLNGCSTLVSLPVGLIVGGSLDCTGCVMLATVPEDLYVNGTLTLSGTAITSLPSSLTVAETLYLESCTRLDSLPSSILDWPMQDNGQPHQIFIGGSGISQETLTWLRESNAENLRFHVTLHNQNVQNEERIGFQTLMEAYQFWLSEVGELPPATVPVIDPAHLPSVLNFLSRLRSAKEFGLSDTRLALAKRVKEVLSLLDGSPDVRIEVVQRMMDSLDACDDKPVWALNQITLVANCVRARGNREALKALGRRVLRLMVVHEHAQKKIASLNWVDDVCVYLKMEIELREPLDLPVAAVAMHFPSYIKISAKELDAARKEAEGITEEQFENWLQDWPEWKRQLRSEVAAKIKWKNLPGNKRRSLLRRSLKNMLGIKSEDPVFFRGNTWSLSDLLRHWVSTGLDFHNSPTSAKDLEELTRVGG